MKKIFTKNWLLITILLIIAVAGTLYILDVNREKTWVKVESKDIQEAFTVSGNIEALNKNNLNAPFQGKIVEVFVKEGDKIKKDQVLARYDKINITAEIASTQAAIKQAELNYAKLSSGNRAEEVAKAKAVYEQNKVNLKEKELAYLNYKKDEDRYRILHEKKMMTPKEYEDYLSSYKISKAQYDSQKFALKQSQEDYTLAKKGFRKEDVASAKEDIIKEKERLVQFNDLLNKTDIKAPIDGVIAKKFVNAGNNVQPGDNLFNLSSKSQLEINAKIEEEDIQNVKLGDIVSIEADAYPRNTIKGQVKRIIDQVDETVKLLSVKIVVLENKNNKQLLPGMTVSCTFAGHPVNYLLVPKEAIAFEGKKAYVETDYGKVYILVGKEHDNKVIVKGNIKEGDKILVE